MFRQSQEQFLLKCEYLGQTKLVALVMSCSGVSQLSLVFVASQRTFREYHRFNTSFCIFLPVALPFCPTV